MSSTTANEETIWKIFTDISKLYDNLYVDEHDGALYIESDGSNHNVYQIISDAAQIILRQLHHDLDTNDVKCNQFLQWMCALSMSFSSAPIHQLKHCLMGNKACVYNLLDIVLIDILQKGLLFVNKKTRKKCAQTNTRANSNSTDTNKAWLFELIDAAPYDKDQLLTPERVKRLSKTLILMVNLVLFIGAKPIICDYMQSSKALSSVLLCTLMQLLGTYVLPESIHMKSMTLPFHSKTRATKAHNHNNNNNANNNNNNDNAVHVMKHNDLTPYISENKWKMQKSAQITIQLHRLLIKCLWMMIHDLNVKDVYSMILRHESQRVMMLQLMHFSVLSFECALELLGWICAETYAYKEREMVGSGSGSGGRKEELLYRLVCNLGVSFVTLCDEYQLEGNEFKVNMFCATLTTEEDDDEEDDEESNAREINDDIIPASKQKEKYVRECGKRYEAYFSNVVRFANCIERIYTFHVGRAILTILPLISLCVSVRTEVAQRKEVIEFLKELFYVTLPQCSYLFIRFQYEAQYSIEDMIPILIKSRSGFNKENVFKFYQNETELQSNCISSLHIFLYLCDMEGVSCKTIIKNLDRTSKREWRNYVQNMSRFISRFGSKALQPIYHEYDFKARLQSLIEFSKPKKVFSEKRHPDLKIHDPSWRDSIDDDVIIPQFEEHVQHEWMCTWVPPSNSNMNAAAAAEPPPFKKRKLSCSDEYGTYAKDEWPITNITIKLSREKRVESKSRKRKRRKYTQYRIVDESQHIMYPDRYYSPCLQEIKLLTQWEPAVIKAQKEKKLKRRIPTQTHAYAQQQREASDSETQSESIDSDHKSLYCSSSSDDEYKPPSAQMKTKLKRRRSKRIKRKQIGNYPLEENESADDDEAIEIKPKPQRRRRKRKKRHQKKNKESGAVPALPPIPAAAMSDNNNSASITELISKNAAKDLKLYGQLKKRDKLSLKHGHNNNNYSANRVIIKQLLGPPHKYNKLYNNELNAPCMNLPDINKSFQANSYRNKVNNYNNNINISINNHYSNKSNDTTKNKNKNKNNTMMVDLSECRSSEEEQEAQQSNNNNNNIIIGNLNSNNNNDNNNNNNRNNLNLLNEEQTLRLRQMLLSNAICNTTTTTGDEVKSKSKKSSNNNNNHYEPYSTPHAHTQFNNDDMFKIDPRLNTRQMANHLFSCFEKQKQKQSKRGAADDKNKTLFRILLIAENVNQNDNVIRIDIDDDDDSDADAEKNENETSHLQESVYCAIKAIALTNNRYIVSASNKKIIFTAQMTKKKRVDLILDCYHEHSQLLMFFRRCDNKLNRIYVNSSDANDRTVHNLAKTIIAHLNEAKYIMLVPNDIKSINIIVESMIVAHSAIKTQFQSAMSASESNQESYWLYCLLEANHASTSLPILGQTNAGDPFSSNWLFKIVMNNNYY